MFRDKIIISLSYFYIVLVILGNTAVILTAYMYDQYYYWALFISVPLLLFLIYNTRKKGAVVLPARVVYNSSAFFNTKRLIVVIGNEQCRKRRLSSIFTIGILEILREKVHLKSKENGIDEKQESEGLITTLNLTGGDRIWRIAPGYDGCRLKSGQFSAEIFKTNVSSHDIKAIEITLSLLTVRGSGINLNDQTQTKIRTSVGDGINSYYGYGGFYNADGMIHFIESLRELSGGKPVGFKIRIHDKKEFQKICYAICKTQIIPDFIVVEGLEEQNNSTELNIANNCGMPLYEALQFVSTTLQNYGLNGKILIIAKASITSGFDMLKALAFGAHAVRTVMPNNRTINCRDSRFSNSDNISRFSPLLQMSILQHKIIEDMARAMESLGFKSIEEMSPASFFRRLCILDSEGFKYEKGYLFEPKPSKIMLKMSSPNSSEQANKLLER